jgi:hypothetical protein
MANTKVTALTELAATPADDDVLYLVDVSNTADDAAGSSRKLKAKYFVKTAGVEATITGGGTIALAGFTLTVPKTGSALMVNDYTAADVLAKLLTVDGAGSGVDADLLDGVNLATIQAYALIQNIYMGDGGRTASTSYTSTPTDAGSAGRTGYNACYIDGSKIPSALKVYLYVLMSATSGSTASVRLFNDSDSTAVTDSEITTTSTSLVWVNSGDIRANLASGLKRYVIQAKNSVGITSDTDLLTPLLVITP